MKRIGALLIVCSCLLYCVRFIRSQRARLSELEGLASLLEGMGAELKERLTPLPELIGLMGGRAGGSALSFICELEKNMLRLGDESFADIWQDCFRRSFKLLDERESRAAMELGMSLGRFEVDAQLRAIDGCTRLLRERASELRREQRDKRRVHMGLACAGGAMLVIVLI